MSSTSCRRRRAPSPGPAGPAAPTFSTVSAGSTALTSSSTHRVRSPVLGSPTPYSPHSADGTQATSALTLDGRLVTPTTIVAPGSVARGAVLRRSAPARAMRATAALEASSAPPRRPVTMCLVVATGPMAGSTIPLAPTDDGEDIVIGRAELGDASVSARHASIQVGRDGAVTVRDLRSLNGTTVDGISSTVDAGVTTGAGAVVRLGAVVARIEDPAAAETRARPPADTTTGAPGSYSLRGTRTLHRGPRLLVMGEATPIVVPGARPALTPPRLRWVSIVLPLLLAGAIVAVTGDPRFGLLALLGPLLAAGTYLEDRRQYRRGRRRDDAAEAGDLDAFRQALVEQRHRAFADAHARVVDPASAARIARLLEESSESGRSRVQLTRDQVAGLWERRRSHPDFGLVTLAYATLLWKPTLDSSGHAALTPGAQANVGECAAMADAPVTTLLQGGSSIGFTGRRHAALHAVRAILAELAISSGPADIAIAVLTTPEHAADWAWTAWLPHVAPFDDGASDCSVAVTAEQVDTLCAAIMAARTRAAPQGGGATLGSGATPPTGPALVVVVVDDEDRARRGDPALRALSAQVELDRDRGGRAHGDGARPCGRGRLSSRVHDRSGARDAVDLDRRGRSCRFRVGSPHARS